MSNSVTVALDPNKGSYVITYIAVNSRHKRIPRRFMYNVANKTKERQEIIDESLIQNLMEKKVLGEKTAAVILSKKPYELKSELAHLINKITRSTKRGKMLTMYGFGQKKKPSTNEQPAKGEQLPEKGGQDIPPNQMKDAELPSESIFACEKESANTKVFLAPSFSGKTTLMVTELNKLTRAQLAEYDKILLFTESTSSAPLKKLDKKVREKMMIYDRFVPQFVRILKKINTVTKNRFRFLLLLDDCIDLKGGILIKLVLTLRNANISTVISIQYSKLLSRSQRQSIHDYYMINMKLEDLEYLMSGFLAPHFRALFEKEGTPKEEVNKMNYRKLSERAKERLTGKILHFDQRHDEITIYNRPTA